MSAKKPSGCGCGNIPISFILLLLGVGYWAYSKYGLPDPDLLLARIRGQEDTVAITPTPVLPETSITETELPAAPLVTSSPSQTTSPSNPVSPPTIDNLPFNPTVPKATPKKPSQNNPAVIETPEDPAPQTSKWEQKKLRGIYFSRYQITNNASEQMIRDRVRYYKSQGINTIIHGVWGNACTMYKSQVMQQTLGFDSCPNLFREDWLNWLIDEAHQQGMEVHAYFEKGIKIDSNSPIYDLAVQNNWLVPGIDKTYAGVDHYVLDVANPEVAAFFRNIVAEFVQLYPDIDAVQWDDYVGYHAELPTEEDKTAALTKFVTEMISAMKAVNPDVSFDICHHNPYWAKRYFAADWKSWGVDRAFIQAYNEKGFAKELDYVKSHDGIAITSKQFHRLPQLLEDPEVESIFVFPLSGRPEETAAELKEVVGVQGLRP